MAENDNEVKLYKPEVVEPPTPAPVVDNIVIPDLKTIDESRGQVVSTTNVQTGKTLEGPKPVETPDYTTINEKIKSDAEKNIGTAKADAETLASEYEEKQKAIQKDLEDKKTKLDEKIKASTEEDIARRKVLKEEIIQQNREDRAKEAKTIQNTFSHLLAQGKDSGYINALNLNATRQANKAFNDSRNALNLQFMQDSINVYNKESDRLFSLEEGLLSKTTEMDVASLNFSTGLKKQFNEYKSRILEGASQAEIANMTEDLKIKWQAQQQANESWDNSVKDAIDLLIDQNKFDEAMEMASQAAGISDNAFFTLMSDPDMIEALRQDYDADVMNQWQATLNGDPANGVLGVTTISLVANEQDPTYQAESMNKAFGMMMNTPEKAKGYISNIWNNSTEEEKLKWGVTESDKAVIEEYLSGKRTLADEEFRKSFFNVMMKEAKDEQDRLDWQTMADNTGIDEFVKDSPSVASDALVNWYKDGYNNYLDIDLEDGGTMRINFFDNVYDANDIDAFQGLAGLDSYLREFKGDAGTENAEAEYFTSDYGVKESETKKIVGGVTYTNKELFDAYQQYFKEHTARWNKAADRNLVGPPLTMDEWTEELRTANRNSKSSGTGGVTNIRNFMKDAINKATGTQERAGVDVNKFNVGLFGDKTADVAPIPSDIYNALDEDNREVVNKIASSGTGDVSIKEFSRLYDEAGLGYQLDKINKSKDGGLYLEQDAIGESQLSRGTAVEQPGTIFSTENLQDTMSKLTKKGDNLYEGIIVYGGVPYKIKATPSVWKRSSGADNWHPTVRFELTLPEGGEPRIIDSLISKTDVSLHSDDTLAKSNAFFKELSK